MRLTIVPPKNIAYSKDVFGWEDQKMEISVEYIRSEHEVGTETIRVNKDFTVSMSEAKHKDQTPLVLIIPSKMCAQENRDSIDNQQRYPPVYLKTKINE